MLLLWLYYFCISYVWYFYITWLSTYMSKVLHLDLKATETAILGGLPLFLGGARLLHRRWAANRLLNRVGGLGQARRIIGVVGTLGAGTLLVVSTLIGNPVYAMIAMGLSGFATTSPCPVLGSPVWMSTERPPARSPAA